jgi:transcription initiation factor TFIIA small subunit
MYRGKITELSGTDLMHFDEHAIRLDLESGCTNHVLPSASAHVFKNIQALRTANLFFNLHSKLLTPTYNRGPPAHPQVVGTMSCDNYEFYRATSIGDALMETLNDLITEHRISGDLAIKVLHNFDRVVPEVLAADVKATTLIKGKINHYKLVDEVLTFVLKNAKFTTRENGHKKDVVRELIAENITLLACPSKKTSG